MLYPLTAVTDNVLQRSDTLTRVKLFSDLSQSPYCLEYVRLKLGSLTFSASNKESDWRVSAINMGYAVCNRLGVIKVPVDADCKSLFQDDHLFSNVRMFH